MLKDKVKEQLRGKTWTFQEITSIAEVVDGLMDMCYSDLNAQEKLDLIWNVEIWLPNQLDGMPFGQFFQKLVQDTMTQEIAKIVKEELESATIEFKVNKNEVSEGSVGGKSHKKRSTDEESKDKQQE
tara:strand:- start:6485 stop:6865 length:381 start_codon:yes stop_codon:yes gene_type:complete